ncbi:MAG: DMT family transporter [Leifsonia flava]
MTQQDAPAATDAPHGAPARSAVIAAVACAVVAGVLVAVQSRINGELGQQLGDGFAAALISFGSGLVILLIALAFWRPGRAGFRRVPAALRDGRLRWWMLFGGAAGAFLVLSQGLTAAVLGVALFSVATVAGQSISGLLVDRTTLVSGGPRHLTVPRVVGAGLAILAVVVSVATQLNGDAPFWMLVLPFLAGLGLGWQQAVNGRVRESAESALTATVGNFAVGTVVLLIAFLVHSVAVGWPQSLPSEPWLYLGGAIGCVFIAAAAVLVRITGTLVLSLAMIAGQLVAAIVIDTMLPGHAGSLAVSTVVGTALALAAVVVAGVNWRQFRRAV